MNLNLCAIALLLFGSLSVAHSRAVDIVDDANDADNSIEADSESQSTTQSKPSRPFEEDWLKVTKSPPAKIRQEPGAIVEIVCEMMGSQVPTIQWVVGHMPLSEVKNLETNTVPEDAPTAIVRVRSVHIVDHMLSEPRTYTCIGSSGSKTQYARTVVYPALSDHGLGGMIVTEKQYQGPQKPRIIYTEKTHLDLMGSTLMLPCKVHARPRAKVTWRNNEEKEVVNNHRFKVLPSGDLLISDLKWEDMGNYKCIARNEVGHDSAETFVYPVLKEQD